MSNDHYYTSGQHHRNERSRETATQAGQPWSTQDSRYIQEHWVDVPAADRDERAIARRLGRTIEACRNHAEVLRGSRPRAGGGKKNQPDCIARQTIKPYIATDDDDPLSQWYA